MTHLIWNVENLLVVILHRDLVQLEKALLYLYAPGLGTENYAERAFGLLGELIAHESIGLIIRDIKSAQIDIALDHPLPDLQKFGEAFGKLAPQYPWFWADPSIHNGRPHSRSDFCSDRQFRNLDIHSEIFRHWGHQNFLSMYVHTEQSRVVFFGFNKGRQDFTAKERALAAVARPHLSTARHLALALQAAKSRPLPPDLFVRHGFTPRESDVLYWLTEGKSNIEIAAILRLQLSTVKGNLTAIFDKIGIGSRHAAILYALDLAKRSDLDFYSNPSKDARLQVPYLVPPTKVG